MAPVPVKSLQWRHNGHDGVSNHQPHHYLLNCLFWPRSKKTSKLRVTSLCAGNSPVTSEFPAQMASNAENVSIWWHHHISNLEECGYKHRMSLWRTINKTYSVEYMLSPLNSWSWPFFSPNHSQQTPISWHMMVSYWVCFKSLKSQLCPCPCSVQHYINDLRENET